MALSFRHKFQFLFAFAYFAFGQTFVISIGLLLIKVFKKVFLSPSFQFLSLNLKNSSIELLFKEQELILSKTKNDIFIENCFMAKITNITKGELLSQIELLYEDFVLRSILNSKFINEFKINENVYCYIKANDIILRA